MVAKLRRRIPDRQKGRVFTQLLEIVTQEDFTMMKSKNLLIRFGLVLILGLAAVGCPPPELIKPPEVDKPPEVETGPQEIAERPAVEKPPADNRTRT
jgi:hypothetical protein